MRTLQEKYNAIQEGAFSKDQFLRDARMQHPTLVTQYNGYDDAVQILKNRGMISEVKKVEVLSEALNKDIKAFGQDLDNKFKAAGFDTLIIMQPASPEQLNVVKTNPKAAIFEVSQNQEAQMLIVRVNPKMISQAESIINKFQLSDYNGPVLQKGWTAKQVKGAINPGDIVKQDANRNQGVWEFYRLAKVNTKVANINEARLTKKSLVDYRYKPTNELDNYPYEQILRGLRVELEIMGIAGTPTPEEYQKALGKVLKNLEKDEIFYTNQLAGKKKSDNEHDQMVPVEKNNVVDKANGMKKAPIVKEGADEKYRILPVNKDGKKSFQVMKGAKVEKVFPNRHEAEFYRNKLNKVDLKEGIKNLIKNLLAEDTFDFEPGDELEFTNRNDGNKYQGTVKAVSPDKKSFTYTDPKTKKTFGWQAGEDEEKFNVKKIVKEEEEAFELKIPVKKIQKLVDTANALIEKAVDTDGDPIGVVDTSGTWQEPDYYKPIEFDGKTLIIRSTSQTGGDKEVVDEYEEENLFYDGIPSLQLIIRLYKKALKKHNIEEVMYGDSDGDYDSNKETEKEAYKLYDKGQELYNQGKKEEAEALRQQALKKGSWLGWGEEDLPAYKEESNIFETVSLKDLLG